jgi:hypothetical protein
VVKKGQACRLFRNELRRTDRRMWKQHRTAEKSEIREQLADTYIEPKLGRIMVQRLRRLVMPTRTYQPSEPLDMRDLTDEQCESLRRSVALLENSGDMTAKDILQEMRSCDQ